MTLASIQFLVFLAAVWLLWRHAMPGPEARRNLLLVASYVFYGTWDIRFIPVLLATTVVQWWFGTRIVSTPSVRERRGWLMASIAFGIGLLFYFKYAGFFVSQLAALLSAAGLVSLSPLAPLAAPIGISFYTFLSLSYTFDLYRGHATPTRRLRDFALYIAFFGHVTAGPISRARLLLPQLERIDAGRSTLAAQAVFLIARGLAKKLVFSDVLSAEFVRPAFSSPADWSPWFLLIAVFAYSFQIYMDVSGYTDIARGTARCFGYDLMLNFDRPYLARSVSNFWQRWHISVSSFFRDYLYFGLGGSRRGNVYVNLMLTFVAIGLWHGAGWNFVLYGCAHGSMVCIERWRRTRRQLRGLPEAGAAHPLRATLATFMFVAFSRILFVSADLPNALKFVHSLFRGPATGGAAGPYAYGALMAAVLLHFLPKDWERRGAARFFALRPWQQGTAYALGAVALMAWATDPQPFVYFRF
jgi:D-alanyl-lipoteichoic acid acyltransferase DltB (MBOAT superfamily)